MANPANVELDVGFLWCAPVGTAEPTGNVSTGASPLTGYRSVGYSDSGTKFTWTPSFQPIYVEEELFPIRWSPDKAEATVEVVLDEATRQNFALATNAGANAVNDTTAYEPPILGTELRVMLLWDSAVNGQRWLFRQCLQVGPVVVERRKAPNKTMFTTKFQLEKPVGLQPFKVWPSSTGLA